MCPWILRTGGKGLFCQLVVLPISDDTIKYIFFPDIFNMAQCNNRKGTATAEYWKSWSMCGLITVPESWFTLIQTLGK